jgi:hypothetical protein
MNTIKKIIIIGFILFMSFNLIKFGLNIAKSYSKTISKHQEVQKLIKLED